MYALVRTYLFDKFNDLRNELGKIFKNRKFLFVKNLLTELIFL